MIEKSRYWKKFSQYELYNFNCRIGHLRNSFALRAAKWSVLVCGNVQLEQILSFSPLHLKSWENYWLSLLSADNSAFASLGRIFGSSLWYKHSLFQSNPCNCQRFLNIKLLVLWVCTFFWRKKSKSVKILAIGNTQLLSNVLGCRINF